MQVQEVNSVKLKLVLVISNMTIYRKLGFARGKPNVSLLKAGGAFVKQTAMYGKQTLAHGKFKYRARASTSRVSEISSVLKSLDINLK